MAVSYKTMMKNKTLAEFDEKKEEEDEERGAKLTFTTE